MTVQANPFNDGLRLDEAEVGLVSGYELKKEQSIYEGTGVACSHLLLRGARRMPKGT